MIFVEHVSKNRQIEKIEYMTESSEKSGDVGRLRGRCVG